MKEKIPNFEILYLDDNNIKHIAYVTREEIPFFIERFLIIKLSILAK